MLKPETQAQKRRRGYINGGIRKGIALTIATLKDRLPEDYHSLLDQVETEITPHSMSEYSEVILNYGVKKDRTNKKPEDDDDYRHPNDFDPQAHYRRHNYDYGWQDDEY